MATADLPPLSFHDTGQRATVPFIPRDPKHISLYVCGPTVYDRIHIGNARPLVVFDVLYRLLRLYYPAVTYVRNITDVDDKINARAKERGLAIGSLTKETTAAFHEDAAALGCLSPDHEPRATDHIAEMIDHISQLIEKNHAYVDQGHVLFSVGSFAEYGEFAMKPRDELIAGARVEIAPYKKDLADFVLWKPSTGDEPGWESPFGFGRPGWHIECSAMSARHLGPDFDIHGGGIDLVFPHHQNEIAQSLCVHPPEARHDRFARYWLHNGFVMVDGEKMAKSLGNFRTVGDLLENYPGEVLRLCMLQTHYRRPLDFSFDRLQAAKAELDGFYRLFYDCGFRQMQKAEKTAIDPEIAAALADDLNTPRALARLHQLARMARKSMNESDKGSKTRDQHLHQLSAAAALMGLLGADPESWLKGDDRQEEEPVIEGKPLSEWIAERKTAKAERDFALADSIRDRLANEDIILEDIPGGDTNWRWDKMPARNQ